MNEIKKIDRFGDLTMENVVYHIKNEVPFSALKLCHGFWEKNVRFQREIEKQGIHGEPDFEQWDKIINSIKVNWPTELYLELRQYLKNAHKTPMLLNLASEYGWKKGGEIEGTPLVGLDETRHVIKEIISDQVQIYDGLFWKNAVLDGSITKFFEIIKHLPVMIVGPHYIKHFPEFAGFKNSLFVEVHDKRAAWDRMNILEEMRQTHNQLGGKNVVCLLEAGGACTAWLISRLYPEFNSSYLIALGQVLNLCNFTGLNNKNWFMVYRKEVCEAIQKINPDWTSRKIAYDDEEQLNNRNTDFMKIIHTRGYHEKLYSLFESRLQNKMTDKAGPCAFIENKPVDINLFQQILKISSDKNHWANYGPVSYLLEDSIGHLININQDKRIVMCKSATTAIHALVGMYNIKESKSLRWVVCAYGFLSSNIGPLTDAIVLDCDQSGMLDLNELMALDADTWDAVMVTNIFGLCKDLSPYINYCKSQGKVLIVDSAMALLTESRNAENMPDEAISFHQTKPWGLGEGGCAVIDSSDENLFRTLLNFGATMGDEVRPYATNGKLSDFDSALILQRLINMPDWQRLYKLQAKRIDKIARNCGLLPLAEFPENIIMGNLPFLAPGPVTREAILNSSLTLRKYYHPLTPEHKISNSIFSRIINIPCHPQVAGVSDEEIEKVFKKIVNQN